MISTYQKLNNFVFALFITALLLVPVVPVLAQSALTMSVSPTLFEMSASPGQEWNSSVRVINSNPYDIEVFVNVRNFVPQGEGGTGKFVPVFAEESAGGTLAEWVKNVPESVLIAAEQTATIPFTISVPLDSAPGGHAAAILIGTKSLSRDGNNTGVETSQVVSSLIFLKVAGEVTEDGYIRDFYATKSVYESPEVTFELRFENKGNVHIRPQGHIKIYNMWGQERGTIPVNRQTLFGNVLPDSVRKYRFTWEGQWSLADMGRYTAVAALAYGDNERKSANSETYFWVIPWKILLTALLIIAGFIMFMSWAIKLYVRKMLSMAGVSPELQSAKHSTFRTATRRVSVTAPIEEGILDLRARMGKTGTGGGKMKELLAFTVQYKIFFIATAALLLFLVGLIWYISSASVSERDYQITINDSGEAVIITADDVEAETAGINQEVTPIELPTVSVVNRSGIDELTDQLVSTLTDASYEIDRTENDYTVIERSTVIVYDPDLATEALALSRYIPNALLSAFETEADESLITIYVGSDYTGAVE